MLRSPIISAMALVLAACSSSGSSGAPVVNTEVTTQRLDTPAGSYGITSVQDRDVMTNTILAPIDTVWRLLPGVFLELDVEPGTIDPQAHVISNTAFIVRRSLGGVQLSKYISCGTGINGPAANQMQVTMSIVVQVVADSAQVSTLRTQVEAHGVAEGTSSTIVNCGTTGALEARIARMVNDDLAHRTHK